MLKEFKDFINRGNVMELAIDAARARATLGEISTAMENAFGRYAATTKTITGVYAANMSKNEDIETARNMTDAFAEAEGRRPRIMIAKLGQDGHDRGAKVVARALADAGYEVVYTGLHQTPEMIAAAAVQEAVDAVGLSIMSGAHMTLFPAVIDALKARGAGDVIVFGGGIVPKDDLARLTELGVAKIFTPGTATTEIVAWVEAVVRPRIEAA